MAPHRSAHGPPRPDRLRAAYDRTHARLWRALRAWSGSRDIADEAAAEAFAQAARRLDDLRDVDAWVWRAAFRIAAGELQRQRRQAQPAGDALDLLSAADRMGATASLHGRGAGSRYYDDGDLPALAVDLVRALGQLTEQQRACVVLRDVAGLTAPEIAKALGTTAGTVRVQLFRSRRTLRHLLEAHDD